MTHGPWIFGVSAKRDGGVDKSGYEIYPRHLCECRGIDWATLPRDAIFIDEELGFAIGTDRVPYGLSPYLQSDFVAPAQVVRFVDDADSDSDDESSHVAPLALQLPPYLSDIYDRWPQWTGSGVRVAVLDSGIGFHCLTPDPLQRDALHRDFCSAKGAGIATHDMDVVESHGTTIAGIIGARTPVRQSIAPGCNIYSAQITGTPAGGGLPAYTTTSNILLMLSWAIHCAGAQIINMSFNAGTIDLDKDFVALLSRIATKLRKKNRALIFASAQTQSRVLGFPANVDGIVAVGKFLAASGRTSARITSIIYPDGWQAKKDDLLFGPGTDQATFSWDRKPRLRGNSSGACAFVSGVAALYLEKYVVGAAPLLDLNGVLKQMRSDARPILDSNGDSWQRAVFPSP